MAESKDEDVNLERPKVPTDDKTSRDDDNTYDQIPPLLRTHADGESTERNQTLDLVEIVEKISNMPNTDDCPRPTSNAPIKLKGENIRRSFDYSSHSDSELSKKTNVGKEVSELDEIDENVNRRSQLKNDPTNSYDNSKPTSNDSPFPPNLPTRDYHKAFTSEDRNILQKEINVKKLGEKINEFKSKTKEFIDKFASTKDEDRTAEEIFIITHLLNNSDPKSPILDGQLDQLAMLACCDSSRVVKRALDVLLNEIFLNISDLSVDRCKNVLEAEEVLRSTFFHFIDVDRYKAKCHRMTTYAWLITLVLLKFGQKEFAELQQKMKQFDQRLSTLMKQKEKNEQSLYRYGICLAKESIKKILQSSSKRDVAEFLKHNIKKCENLVKDKLDKDEVKKLGEEFSDADSWLNIHVCLVFLQDLPKHYHFQDNPRPVILIQMLVADYRGRFSTSKIKNFFRNQRPGWQFELLVYRVMLRLIRTSNNKESWR
ncbi:uncharacterized protein LOC114534175 [Dendronephthya gigantea]|uniref:uncharacterized protein LOC114534175 n=1 Tax=Dendronephthya gigantea TaxID=151771 RepID=UPI00106B3369|nr:uncharacterized protein LOC114534175 [Dendronephthya gigantea]